MVFHWLKESAAKNSRITGKFKHLGIQERMLLAFFLQRGYSKAAIAKELGVHHSIIYRELTHNQDEQFGYHIFIAKDKARERQQEQKQRKLDGTFIL